MRAPDTLSEHVTFHSIHHPGFRGRAFVFSGALVQPLTACLLPVMMGALFSMLQGLPALIFLYAGFPFAVLLSGIWTYIRLQDQVVEIHFRDEDVAVRSISDAAQPAHPIHWYRLLDMSIMTDRLELTLGRELFVLKLAEWDAIDGIIDTIVRLRALDTQRHLPGST